MAADIQNCILGRLAFAKGTNATRSQKLSLINVILVYDLLSIDFNGLLKVSSAGSKFSFDIVDYFSR